MRVSVYTLLAPVALAGASCSDGFDGPGGANGCFMAWQWPSRWTQCKAKCEQVGGTLGSIRNEEENKWVEEHIAKDTPLWLGLFEAGEDESGDWQWVDGYEGNYRDWTPGEPNEWCTDEDCAIFAPEKFPGWVDTSCTVDGWAHCLCREGAVAPTAAYESTIAMLKENGNDYGHCIEEYEKKHGKADAEGHGKGKDDEDSGSYYCRTHGFNTRADHFDARRRAYSVEGRAPAFGGGYGEGTCGYAAWENDDAWAVCCCVDDGFCEPDGEDEDEDEGPEGEEFHGASSEVDDAELRGLDHKLNVIIGLLSTCIAVIGVRTILRCVKARAAESGAEVRGVELSTGSYGHLDRSSVV